MPAPISESSLESFLQNLSLTTNNNNQNSSSSGGGMAEPPFAGNKSSATSSDSMEDHDLSSSIDQSSSVEVELNSESPLPQFWEQCLDLKTGEIYYINWRTGLRYDEDPRTNPDITADHLYVYPEDDDEEEDDDNYSYDSEDSSSEESVSSYDWLKCNNISNNNNLVENKERGDEQVLVVVGCKNCLMYFMEPKQVNNCSKCHGQLLHFDRSSDDVKP